MSEYFIDGPDDSLRNLVGDSWRRSMQDAYSAMPTRAYVFWANKVINSFIGSDVHRIELRDDDFVLVARDKHRPNYVLGWLIGTDKRPSADSTSDELLSTGCAIHWVYVKKDHRHEGIAADLIATAIERCEPGEVTYGVHTRFDGVWERLGLTFRPIQEFEKAGGR